MRTSSEMQAVREIHGPESDLIHYRTASDRHFIELVFKPPFVDLPALTTDIDKYSLFLQRPDAAGLVPLLRRELGIFEYEAGESWSIAELIAKLTRFGERGGYRAGLELCELGALILQEAAELGQAHGVYAHGSLTPWRILLDAEGIPLVIGYGLPPVEVQEFLRGDERIPSIDAFRYAPPERLRGEPEDIRSDIFSLALISIEIMLGVPLYDGAVDEVFEQAETGSAWARLQAFGDQVPDLVKDVLGPALEVDPSKRYRDALEFADFIRELLSIGSIEGPGLADLVARIRHEAAIGAEQKEEFISILTEIAHRLGGELEAIVDMHSQAAHLDESLRVAWETELAALQQQVALVDIPSRAQVQTLPELESEKKAIEENFRQISAATVALKLAIDDQLSQHRQQELQQEFNRSLSRYQTATSRVRAITVEHTHGWEGAGLPELRQALQAVVEALPAEPSLDQGEASESAVQIATAAAEEAEQATARAEQLGIDIAQAFEGEKRAFAELIAEAEAIAESISEVQQLQQLRDTWQQKRGSISLAIEPSFEQMAAELTAMASKISVARGNIEQCPTSNQAKQKVDTLQATRVEMREAFDKFAADYDVAMLGLDEAISQALFQAEHQKWMDIAHQHRTRHQQLLFRARDAQARFPGTSDGLTNSWEAVQAMVARIEHSLGQAETTSELFEIEQATENARIELDELDSAVGLFERELTQAMEIYEQQNQEFERRLTTLSTTQLRQQWLELDMDHFQPLAKEWEEVALILAAVDEPLGRMEVAIIEWEENLVKLKELPAVERSLTQLEFSEQVYQTLAADLNTIGDVKQKAELALSTCWSDAQAAIAADVEAVTSVVVAVKNWVEQGELLCSACPEPALDAKLSALHLEEQQASEALERAMAAGPIAIPMRRRDLEGARQQVAVMRAMAEQRELMAATLVTELEQLSEAAVAEKERQKLLLEAKAALREKLSVANIALDQRIEHAEQQIAKPLIPETVHERSVAAVESMRRMAAHLQQCHELVEQLSPDEWNTIEAAIAEAYLGFHEREAELSELMVQAEFALQQQAALQAAAEAVAVIRGEIEAELIRGRQSNELAAEAVRQAIAIATERQEQATRDACKQVEAAASRAAVAVREAAAAILLGEEDSTDMEAQATLASVQEAVARAISASEQAQMAFQDMQTALPAEKPADNDRLARLRRGRIERRENESVAEDYERLRPQKEGESRRIPRFVAERPVETVQLKELGETSEYPRESSDAPDQSSEPEQIWMSREERLARLRRGAQFSKTSEESESPDSSGAAGKGPRTPFQREGGRMPFQRSELSRSTEDARPRIADLRERLKRHREEDPKE